MSKLSVLTGATGHIGYALLKELLDSGERVRILIRKDIPLFDGLDCEKVFGDVTDPKSLETAFEGADVVYHLTPSTSRRAMTTPTAALPSTPSTRSRSGCSWGAWPGLGNPGLIKNQRFGSF